MCNWFTRLLGRKCNCEKCCQPTGPAKPEADGLANTEVKSEAGQPENEQKIQ